MRVLLLLRGSAGCGKSTWIEENGLKLYTLSADDIRLMCQSPVMKVDGTYGISPSKDGFVWKTLFNLLEQRMKRGEFTVIDATNSKSSEMSRYKKLCEDYRYRIFCVDFTDIPIEEVKRRNRCRAPYKRVPDEVIDNMYARFATQKIPGGIKVIKPEEFDLRNLAMKTIDLSEYKRIHHIGDIHGCYTALQKYLSDNGGIKDDEFYIFTGDYIDRGIENVEVIKFLLSVKDKKNVFLLEGNHERWLWLYGNDKISGSKEFELVTKPQLEKAGIEKKEIRQLYRKLGQCAHYTYGDKEFLITHGGLSMMVDDIDLLSMATEQMIRGVGSYNDFETIADTWMETSKENMYQIHGHRNTKMAPVQIKDRVFNLEGRVEFGGNLRCVQVNEQGIHVVEVKNEVFKTPEEREETITNTSMADVVIALRNNKYIREKNFGNISSFNFTSQAFYEKAWDEQTTKARGLYIDTVKGKVVARSYNKFFAINERPETMFENLQDILKFPVTAYVKENGFLGIVSYNEYEDDLLITSKSDINGPWAQYLKDMVYKKMSPESVLKMKEYAKANNVSFVFECVDMENDPHVIKYPESELFLLDVIYNDMEFKKLPYDEIVDLANQLSIVPKEKAFEIATWQEFYDWYHEVLDKDYEYNNRLIEGFVIEDANNFMIKLKLTYYNFWKFMRSIAHETIKAGTSRRTSALTTPLANEFYSWTKELSTAEDKDSLPKDICALRDMFYANKKL